MSTRLYHAPRDVHGAARFPRHADLAQRGYGPGQRLSFGYARADADGRKAQEVSYGGVRHVNYFAPNRSGKGVTLMRHALQHTGSLVHVALRPEEAAVYARYRKEVLGQRVVLLDPCDAVASELGFEADTINLMDVVRGAGPGFFEAVATMADGMMIPDDHGEAFWQNAGLDALGLALARAAIEGDEPTVFDGVDLFNMTGDELARTLGGTWEATEGDEPPRKIADGLVDAADPLVRGAARRLAGNAQKTLANILATVRANTWVWDSPTLARAFGTSSFDLTELAKGRMTIVIAFPSDVARFYAVVIRLVVLMCMHVVSRSRAFPDPPCLYLWDEIAMCGHSRQLIDTIGMQAGDGNQIVTVWQDVSQAKRVYGDAWETFVANAGMTVVFGTSDLETLRYFSALSGTADVRTKTAESARAQQEALRGHAYLSTDDRTQGRPLLPPAFLQTLAPHEAVFFPAGSSPVVGYKAPYFLDAMFRDRRGAPVFESPPRYRDKPPAPAIDFRAHNEERLAQLLAAAIPPS